MPPDGLTETVPSHKPHATFVLPGVSVKLPEGVQVIHDVVWKYNPIAAKTQQSLLGGANPKDALDCPADTVVVVSSKFQNACGKLELLPLRMVVWLGPTLFCRSPAMANAVA